MPRKLQLTNAKQRNAKIDVVGPSGKAKIFYQSPEGSAVASVRLIKATEGHTLEDLLVEHGDLDSLAEALIQGDPEIDTELVDRVYIDTEGSVLYSARVLQVREDNEGNELAREDFQDTEPTVGEEIPLMWRMGKLMPIKAVVRRFAFSRKMQLKHHDGVTFDFLFNIAKELHDKKQMMLLRSPSKEQKGRLIFQRNGTPYFGFLEGRVEGESYLLILHLSNLELKRVGG